MKTQGSHQIKTIPWILFGILQWATTCQADDVSCGGHWAASCAECPVGSNGQWYGSGWCNGDCAWNGATDECELIVKDCGGGASAMTCNECPDDHCDSNECTIMSNTNLCRDVFSDDIRTASVHLFYDAPPMPDRPAWWLQRVIPTATADVTYFSSNGHQFGYGGIQQVDENTGRVLFSLWDQGGCDQDVGDCSAHNIATTVACGEGVTCTDFGNEGTGRKSYFDSPDLPVVGQEYFFVTQAAYLGNHRMEYTGYFYMNDSWKLLSRIQVSTNDNEEWWLRGMYSFVEQWSAWDTTHDRSALYGPSYMATTDGDQLYQVPDASYSHGTAENHERVNGWQAGAEHDYAVGIATGGNTVPVANRGDRFDYEPVEAFDELQDFHQHRVPCLNQATTKAEIEACLSEEPPVECVNSDTWRFKTKKKNCDWVARRKKRRCKKKGYYQGNRNVKVLASEACPVACGTCN